MTTCRTCELIANRDAGISPLWDCIHRTPYWDLAHCNDTSLPGWLVLVVRRHTQSLDELSESEARELGGLIRRVSAELKDVTGCLKTYVIQFAESAEHRHVHFHIIPRMADLPEDRRSVHIFEYLGVPEEARVSEETMNKIASNLQTALLAQGDA